MVNQTDFTIEQLRAFVASYVTEPIDTISDEDYLLDVGIDSITMMTIVEELRQKGFPLTFIQLADNPTIKGWHSLIKEFEADYGG
ncbi:acyl carrier protein [Solibacillus sp. A46]|uniref:Acyl carrier protein n=1 Tax=Solibacillus faecavium TaxID=2762221 RepID=A0ABR8XXU6_9BACL|nr:phosphopantetheine-binding protein [Solibacillus faecavium]MBD8036776.1 acyl carrier protein [Solibacillus faecavium]